MDVSSSNGRGGICALEHCDPEFQGHLPQPDGPEGGFSAESQAPSGPWPALIPVGIGHGHLGYELANAGRVVIPHDFINPFANNDVLGVVVGAALSVWASKFIATLLFNVTPRDPLTFAVATAVLFTAALTAGWLPARRAASIDPARVLREQ